jgi:hypothetical protein
MLDGYSTTTLRQLNGSPSHKAPLPASQGFDKSPTPWYTVLVNDSAAVRVRA